MNTENLIDRIFEIKETLNEMINDAYNAYLDDNITKEECDVFVDSFKELVECIYKRFPML